LTAALLDFGIAKLNAEAAMVRIEDSGGVR
jgi:hypothetical protein